MLRVINSNTIPRQNVRHSQLIRCIDQAKRYYMFQQYGRVRTELSEALKYWVDIGEFYRYPPGVIERYPYARALIDNIEWLYQAVIAQDWYAAGLLLLHVESRISAL